MPLLRPRADRSRREGRRVRDGRDRPRRPARLAVREESDRQGAGSRGGRPRASRAGGGCRSGRRRGARTVSVPPVVDAAWLAEHIGDDDVLVADVRGPNAHARGHIAGSIPMMIGTPGQFANPELRETFAGEAALRLRRHGVTGDERLVLYDGGDCVNAAAALQVAELGGHQQVAVLAGGLAGWTGELEPGIVEVEKTRAEMAPQPGAVAGWWEVADDPGVLILDVRREDEFTGRGGYPCDPRQGHIAGARHVEVSTLFAAPGVPRPAEE